MEPKYIAFQVDDCTPQSSSFDVRWARIPRDIHQTFQVPKMEESEHLCKL